MGKKKFNSIVEAYLEMKEGKISEEEFHEAMKRVGEMLKNFPYPEKKVDTKDVVSMSTKIPKQKKKKD